MRLLAIFLALIAPILAASSSPLSDSTTVYIQPLTPNAAPLPLAEISYNPSTLLASITSFFPPELPDATSHLKVGIYDPSASTWKSSISLTSTESFARGYQPTIVLTLDAQGEVLGVSITSGKIDAGATRDFGPKVIVRGMGKSKSPVLNKPVVLNPEGKVAQPEPEKTLLQKYWWVLLGGVLLIATAGGGAE